VGGSVDYSWVNFSANSTLGFINPDLTVTVNPAILGNGSIISTLGGFGYGPINIDTRNTYYGLYATDTFDVTDRLALTGGARLNIARIGVVDKLGTSPDLNSDQVYSRVNPLVGLTHQIVPGMSFYTGYSESNRAPTALENGCSNPAKPCLLESFLVSDPPLKQVVAKTYEGGLRGSLPVHDGKFDWKLGFFRTDSFDDIISLASSIQGRGFFTNVEQTRRQGLEASVQYQSPRWLAYASYSYLDATYQFTGDIASPNNPSSDADGNVHVVPGNRIPGVPQHQAKFGVDFLWTPEWKVGGTVVVVGSRYFVGDPANQNVQLPAYWVANLHTSYQINKNVQVFGIVNNLFNQRYALFGSYFEPQGVQNAGLPIALTDQRTQVLGQPLAVYAGLRVKL
jgi:iron complex outermembrane receptor protein